ncbi:hypothetical protein SASPL_111058 [Salvia splendens]|uniref:RING-CH-type domain-containing protein n=1 Tax=Salvia splendens TaxID=180675 RepID=A0A8X9A4S8_SALSN|nr:uncharacterized protein LOC121800289 [Salvia splendens]KAG6426824.1 hypothetical protein SASPL_111058 [Salvia splendens]
MMATNVVEFAMKEKWKAARPWNRLVIVLEHSRYCIQRWCDEKGNTTCEICLQKFKPGYSAPAKKQQEIIHTAETISLFVAINDGEVDSIEEIFEPEHCRRCVAAYAGCRRSLALVNLFDAIIGGTQGYPFSVVTVFLVKATGIIVPMYMLFWLTEVIHNTIINHKYYYQNPGSYPLSSSDEVSEDEQDIHEDENV